MPKSYGGQAMLTRVFGGVGFLAVIYAATVSVRSAMQTGLVYVGNIRGSSTPGQRFAEVYVPWMQGGPLAVELALLAAGCIALAFPAARVLTFDVHPMIALLLAVILIPLIAPFCTSWVGNAVFLPFAGCVIALLLKMRTPQR